MSDSQTVGLKHAWRSATAGCSTALAIILACLPGLPVMAEPLHAYAPSSLSSGSVNPCSEALFAGAELDCNALQIFGTAGIAAPVIRSVAPAQHAGGVRLPDNPPAPPMRRMLPPSSGGTITFTHVTVPDITVPVRSEAAAGQQQPAARVAMAREAAPNLIMRTDVPIIGPVLPDRPVVQSDDQNAGMETTDIPIAASSQTPTPRIEGESVSLPVSPPAPPRQTLPPSQMAAATTVNGGTLLPQAAPLTTSSIDIAGDATGGTALRTAQAETDAASSSDDVLAGGPQDETDSTESGTAQARTDDATTDLPPSPEPRKRVPTSGTAISLDQAIEMAVRRSPKVGLASARSWDAYYGVNVARSVRRPQVEGTFGVGQQTLGTDRQNETWRLMRGGDEVGYARFDAQLSLRQLIYDFGESRRSIASANHNYFSERFRMISRIDEVASDTITAYLSLMEQRTLITAAEENLEAHIEFEELVRLNEANGNGTQADVERIVARRLDAQTLLTDLEAALEDAADQLERLTRTAPGVLSEPRSIDRQVPRNPDLAMAHMAETNPQLLSIQAGRQAAEYALESHRAKTRPRIEFELTGKNDNYYNARSRNELDVKSMLTLRHRFSDGGKRRNELRQLEMRVEQQIYRYEDTRIDLEADIRRLYRAIQAADEKVADLEEGLKSSRKVRELYTEQFREGGRTLFELLDAQTALFNAIRERTNNRYTRLRAQYQLLKTIGLLGESVYAEMGR
jgi:TolC family type I secretion outer membrane protein